MWEPRVLKISAYQPVHWSCCAWLMAHEGGVCHRHAYKGHSDWAEPWCNKPSNKADRLGWQAGRNRRTLGRAWILRVFRREQNAQIWEAAISSPTMKKLVARKQWFDCSRGTTCIPVYRAASRINSHRRLSRWLCLYRSFSRACKAEDIWNVGFHLSFLAGKVERQYK